MEIENINKETDHNSNVLKGSHRTSFYWAEALSHGFLGQQTKETNKSNDNKLWSTKPSIAIFTSSDLPEFIHTWIIENIKDQGEEHTDNSKVIVFDTGVNSFTDSSNGHELHSCCKCKANTKKDT